MSPNNVDIKVSVKGLNKININQLMSPINVDIKFSVKGSKQD
jgi:hypothetical protein